MLNFAVWMPPTTSGIRRKILKNPLSQCVVACGGGLLFKFHHMIELVLAGNDGQPVTTTVLVAQKFGKRHSYVIESVRNLINSTEKSAEFFIPSTYIDESGKENVMYVMNRDGFTLLAMGFTGKKALKFKMDYIAAFNAMESELRKLSVRKPLSQLEILSQSVQVLVEHERRMAAMQQSIGDVEGRLDKIERVQKENALQLSSVELSEEVVPMITMRNQVRQLVNKYSKAQGICQDKVWNKIYEQLYYIHGISIRAHKRDKGETLMDVAVRIGCVEKMYAIISNLIRDSMHPTKI